MKHVFIMYDTKKSHDFEETIQEVMKNEDYEVIYTHSTQEAKKVIQNYPEKARMYSVGGDGSANALVQGLVNTEHELVIVPLGTGNDFCRILTNEKDPIELLKRSLSCQSQKVDTVKINDHYYLNTACFGVDSVIANHVHDTPDIPFVPESKSYIVSILQHVFKYDFGRVRIESEGKVIFDDPVTVCTLNNGQYFGGGFRITPQADIQDGYLDVCVVDKLPKAKIPYILTFLIREKLDKRKEVHFFKLKEADVYTSNPGNIDGEEYNAQHYHFEVMPGSLNLVMYK